jgi:hypothetical protein
LGDNLHVPKIQYRFLPRKKGAGPYTISCAMSLRKTSSVRSLLFVAADGNGEQETRRHWLLELILLGCVMVGRTMKDFGRRFRRENNILPPEESCGEVLEAVF